MLPDLLWAGTQPPVRLVPLPGAPAREVFTATRTSSAGRTDLEAVRAALTDAFAELDLRAVSSG
ncbi:MAG: hypothetical protein ACOH16_13015 [Propionibacteriaceae bacterium]